MVEIRVEVSDEEFYFLKNSSEKSSQIIKDALNLYMNKTKSSLIIKIKLLNKEARIPFYAYESAAGFDIYSIEQVIIPAGGIIAVSTGLAFEIPQGYCLQFRDRSGLGVKGIHHFAGLIDSDYRGEIKVVLYNSTSKPYTIEKGDRIIQGVISPVVNAKFEVAETLSDTSRGEKGFHSTGKK
jgi:dUTP pyrophosphatase